MPRSIVSQMSSVFVSNPHTIPHDYSCAMPIELFSPDTVYSLGVGMPKRFSEVLLTGRLRKSAACSEWHWGPPWLSRDRLGPAAERLAHSWNVVLWPLPFMRGWSSPVRDWLTVVAGTHGVCCVLGWPPLCFSRAWAVCSGTWRGLKVVVKEATFWTAGQSETWSHVLGTDERVPTNSVLQKNTSGPLLMGMFWNGTAH